MESDIERDEREAAALPNIPLLVLVGPTAAGKTRLAVQLAEHLLAETDGWQMEAVGADSRQIYRWMDIATAKPAAADRVRLPHHLLDLVDPDESYTLAQYQADANAAISAIWSRGRLPLLVGGTGLYLRSVADGLAIPQVAPDPVLRAELEEVAARDGTGALYARLREIDPAAAIRIDAQNPRRLIRALEICLVTGGPVSEQQGVRPTPYRPLILGLTMEREMLYRRADERIDAMLSAGLVEETRELVARGYGWELPAMSSLGYREIGAYLRNEVSLPAATLRFQLSTHGYIRRQLTWFHADSRITWLDAGRPLETLVSEAGALVLSWLSPWLSSDGTPGHSGRDRL